MFYRHISDKIKALSQGFPAIFVGGPRQSGKTTLVKQLFPKHNYVSLENPDNLDFALHDPKGFLKKQLPNSILDEIQKAPLLFSYLQGIIDETNRPGQWILTGSQQFLLMNKVSQTLAGRCGIVSLLPLSIGELMGIPSVPVLEHLNQKSGPKPKFSWEEIVFQGFYPRIHKEKIQPRDFYSAYYQSYVEKDVRDVLKIGDLSTFRRFVSLCAGRTGQMLDYSSLAMDAGISPPTAKSWLSILEASGLVFILPPHFRNFNKRLTKSPKLYFSDPGLVSYLLEIRSPADIDLHPLRGALFETFVISGVYKLFSHAGEKPPLYFWRDRTGHEVDLLIDLGTQLLPMEIKSSTTLNESSFGPLKWWLGIKKNPQKKGLFIYGGEEDHERNSIHIHPWWHF